MPKSSLYNQSSSKYALILFFTALIPSWFDAKRNTNNANTVTGKAVIIICQVAERL